METNSVKSGQKFIIMKNDQQIIITTSPTQEPSITLTDIKSLFIIIFYTSMLLGFIVFSAYFIDIGYFPVANLASILYLPVIAGLTGFLLIGSLAGLMGLAPFMWVELHKRKDTCRHIVREENAEYVKHAYETGFIDLNENCRMRIFIWYVGVMLFGISLWALAALQERSIYFVLLLILGIIGKNCVLLTSKKNIRSLADSLKNKKIAAMWLLAMIVSYSLLPSLALFCATVALGNLLELNDTLLQVLFAISIVSISSVCLFPFSKKWKLLNWTAIISIISVILLITACGVLTNLSANIMRLFNFGNITNTSIIIDKVGCDIFRLNGFNVACTEKEKRYKINGVNILSRINEYYVQDTKHIAIKFIFSKKHVFSTSIPKQPNPL